MTRRRRLGRRDRRMTPRSTGRRRPRGVTRSSFRRRFARGFLQHRGTHRRRLNLGAPDRLPFAPPFRASTPRRRHTFAGVPHCSNRAGHGMQAPRRRAVQISDVRLERDFLPRHEEQPHGAQFERRRFRRLHFRPRQGARPKRPRSMEERMRVSTVFGATRNDIVYTKTRDRRFPATPRTPTSPYQAGRGVFAPRPNLSSIASPFGFSPFVLYRYRSRF